MALQIAGVKFVAEDADRFKKDVDAASASVANFGAVTVDEMNRIGTATLLAGSGIAALLVAVGLQASRIEELGVLLEVTRQNAIYLAEAEGKVAKAATFTSEAVQEQVQGIRDLHLSGEVANQTVANLIRYNLDWTKSVELARLAQDAATFAMQDSSEAVIGLVRGITTLQPRILRTYGLMINLNVAYKKYAEANNTVVKNMTVMQRQQAAFQEVLSQAPSIAGAYEAAMGTASKQVRSLRTDITNLTEAFGEEYTPALGTAVGITRDLIHWLTELDDPWQAFITYSAAASSAMLIFGGALLKFGPTIAVVASELYILAGAATVAELAIGGLTAGILLGIPAIIGLGAALHRAEEGRRDEAAALVRSSDNYVEYIAALRRAELSNYALTESLYELVRGYDEAGEAAMAQAAASELVANVQGAKVAFALYEVIGGLNAMTEGVRTNLHVMDQNQLLLYANEEAMLKLALAEGYSASEALAFAKAVTELARRELFARDTSRAFTKEVEDWDYEARQAEEGTNLLGQAVRRLDISLAAVNWSQSRREIYETLEATEELTNALEEQAKAYAKFDRQAAEATIDAQEKAAEARIKAEEQKNEALEDQAKKHADKMEDIYEDLADIEIDLQKDIQEAEKETARERLELQQDLARDLEDLNRDLTQDLVDLQRDQQEALEDLDREYAQDRKDALEDLNDDLADMERDLAKELEGIRRDHLQDMLDLEKEYADKRRSIEEDYAQQTQDIEEKYQTEPDYQDTIDARRKALLDELEAIRDAHPEYVNSISQREKDILEELEALKQEELAALEEAMQEELAALEEQLAVEQATRESAYQEELAEAQAAYAERRAERQRQYQETLSDLKEELRLEKEELVRDYARKQEDLKRKHEQERAEVLRRHAEALVDLDTQLAEEKRRLEIAAQENRDRLAEKLQDEKNSNAERRQEIIDDYNKRLGIIDTEEQKEIDEIAKKNALKKQDWIDTYDAIYQSTVDGLQKTLDLAVRPGLQAIVDEHKRKIQEILDAWNNSGLPGQSPSPFFKEMAMSWGEGIKAGFDDTSFQANIDSVIGDLQTQVQTIIPPEQASLPMGMGGRNYERTENTYLNVEPHYQQYQSEASLRDDMSLLVGTLRAWGR